MTTGQSRRTVRNFGRNLAFTPAFRYKPSTEEQVLAVLADHASGGIRVLGAGHGWSPGIETEDALVDMSTFNRVRVWRRGDDTLVTAGAGTRIKRLLAVLNGRGLTLPSLGLITEQTIAGATATGTHGSGKHSLSHYIDQMRVACYGGPDAAPEIRVIEAGPELKAARCSVGCLGVVIDVTLRCVPQYFVEEQIQWASRIADVLAWEEAYPLQQFYLVPYSWRYLCQRRSVARGGKRAGGARWYRLYWLTIIDVSLHLLVKLSAAVFRSRMLVRFLYRRVLPAFVFPRWKVTDRSDRQSSSWSTNCSDTWSWSCSSNAARWNRHRRS